MGTAKKEKSRRAREGTELSTHGNLRVKGENFYRDAKKVKRLGMYKEGRAQRNAQGDITQAASFQSTEIPNARVEPNRKWFGNTRVIAQDALNHFRESLGAKTKDSYQVLLRRNKLPMSLLEEVSHDVPTVDILSNEPFEHTFGPKSQRKKPRTVVADLGELVSTVDEDLEKYEDNIEHQKLLSGALGAFGDNSSTAGNPVNDGFSIEAKEHIFSKGQSKRIWNELYKVIDSSDVVIHVLDARDPMGTRCTSVEQYIKKEAPHKHLIFVLNKCDLVPNWVSVSDE